MSIEGPKKRGRPTREQAAAKAALAAAQAALDARPDEVILEEVIEAFDAFEDLVQSAAEGSIPSLIASGSSGVGKSFRCFRRLNDLGTPYAEVGEISAIGLYKLGYVFKEPGNVIVIDDGDKILGDESGLNILKHMCDSSPVRKMTWHKPSHYLDPIGDETERTPVSYEFYGSIIILTNVNFQAIVDDGRAKNVPHLKALKGRSLYLDLMIHNPRALGLWVMHVTKTDRIFEQEGLTKSQVALATQWAETHIASMRDLQLRSMTKLAGLMISHPDRWETLARMTLLRRSM